ncbi:hypothetical protein BKA56DRAFT_619949 [Ilyonectria sp. MPI-CAGE-AT-0026]|nr:hypothetical protein BKA56DRAFT_619949 [Ilyonectria sp. MPI-CAGE-AT-0026]
MKVSFAMLALAASLGEVNATWGGNWKNAKKYTTPGSSNNQCKDTQKSGWNWDNLSEGSFNSYDGFDFSGWSCKQDLKKRSLDGRTFGKTISGSCGSNAASAPSFSCGSGSKSVSSFSVKTFDIKTEFDCRMEFHYEMGDGSTCKQSADCSSQGTSIHNTQCGGAKKVTFVYPVQDKPKSNCEIEVPTIDFDCDDSDTPSSTIPYGSESTTVPYGSDSTTVPYGGETTSEAFPGETTSIPVGQDTTSVPYGGEDTTTAPAAETTTSGSSGEDTTSVPVEGETTTTAPAEGESTTVPVEGETTTVPAAEDTTSVPYGQDTTTTPAAEATTSGSSGEDTTSVPVAGETTTAPAEGESTTAPVTEDTTFVTTFDSTSTVYTTNIKTITSCGPEVTNCPANSGTVVVVTETVAISTTVCPVTETHTAPAETQPVETQPAEATTSGSSGEATTSVPAAGETTTAPAAAESTTAPVEGESTVPVEGETTVPYGLTTSGSSGEDTTSAPASTYPVEATTIITTYDSTSTVYTTNVKTVTSCGPEVTNCPANSGTVVVVTETVAVSTTICPVTETQVHTPSAAQSSPATASDNSPATTSSPAGGDSYDVPEVVPSCVNTFLDYVSECKDNTDTACYCPKQDFVNKVFNCLYAHGESDDVVAKAVTFFQGLCADYAGENPEIVTGVDSITSIITVTGTTVITSAHYTTIVVATTVTEPCVVSGTTVEGSSTVKTVSTEVTVPQVGFTTGVSGVEVVAPSTTSAAAPYATTVAGTLITKAPTGTGGIVIPTATTAPGEVPVTGSAARNGMGFAAAILAVVFAL